MEAGLFLSRRTRMMAYDVRCEFLRHSLRFQGVRFELRIARRALVEAGELSIHILDGLELDYHGAPICR